MASILGTVLDTIAPDVATYVLPSGRHYWWECERQECLAAERNCCPRRALGSKGAATRQAREHVVDYHRAAPAKVASLVASLTPEPEPFVRRPEPEIAAELAKVIDDQNYLDGRTSGACHALDTMVIHAMVDQDAAAEVRAGTSVSPYPAEYYEGGVQSLLVALQSIGGYDREYWLARIDAQRVSLAEIESRNT